MRRPGLAITLGLLMCLAAAGPAAARTDVYIAPHRAGDPGRVAIFYYPWFGTESRDGAYHHWTQGSALPPLSIGAAYFPARGIYSSADQLVVNAQMAEIAAAGIDTVIVSWWGVGSREDQLMPRITFTATRHDLRVAAHMEPYEGRTAASTEADVAYLRTLGVTDYYVYGSDAIPDRQWADVNRRLKHVRLFANTHLPGKAKAGRFNGLYTYDVLVHSGSVFSRMCASARALRLVCVPSVGPGFDARRATPEERTRHRRDGQTYDHMWHSALRARPDIVTITSYNEWAEGTQIEPARTTAGYASYDGAWGLTGEPAQTAYLQRTLWWSDRFRRVRARYA